MTTPTVRPGGVTAIAIVAAIAGAMDIIAGLGDIGVGGGILTDLGFGATLDSVMTVVGVFLVAVGALGLATGYGLWQLRDWGWQIARIWASFCIVVGLVGVGLSLLGESLVSQILALIAGTAVPAILAVIVLWYIYQPHVRRPSGALTTESAVLHSATRSADREPEHGPGGSTDAHVGRTGDGPARRARGGPARPRAAARAAGDRHRQPEWKAQQRLWGHSFHPMCSYLASFPAALDPRVHRPLLAARRRRPRPVQRARHDPAAGLRGGPHRRRQRPQPVRPPADRRQGRAGDAGSGDHAPDPAPPRLRRPLPALHWQRTGRGDRRAIRPTAGRCRSRPEVVARLPSDDASRSSCSCAMPCASTTGRIASWPPRSPASSTARARATCPS